MKMSADKRFSSFLLDYLTKTKRYFKTFLQVIVSIILTDFEIRDHFVLLTVFLPAKIHVLYTGINSRSKYSYFSFFCFTT